MKKLEKRINQYIMHKGAASIREIAEYLGISPYKVHRIMEDMSSKGVIIKKVTATNLGT